MSSCWRRARRFVSLVALCVLCSSLALAGSGQRGGTSVPSASRAAVTQPAQVIAKKAFAATVLLVTEDAEGQPIALGSGFVVGPGKIATNAHVIDGAVRGYIKPVGQAAKYEIGRVLAIDLPRDLVILETRAQLGGALTLGDSESIEVGDVVYAIGNPQGLEGTFSSGIVSSVRAVGSDRLIQITAAISPGSSGGPVFNDRGQVIGVSVATFADGQNLNFAIPAKYLKPLLVATSPAIPLAEATRPTSRPAILAGSGEQASQGVVVRQAKWGPSWETYGPRPLEFSLHNNLRQDVEAVIYRVIFRDKDGEVVHVVDRVYDGVIPAGLARRESLSVDYSLHTLLPTEATYGAEPSKEEVQRWRESKASALAYPPRGPITIEKGVEFRMLTFSVLK
jgi:hypothetical protein